MTEDRLDQLAATLQRVIERPSFAEAARSFARRYAWPEGNHVAETIARRCVELAGADEPPNDVLLRAAPSRAVATR